VIVDDRVDRIRQLVSAPGTPEAPWQELVEPRWFAFSPDGTHIAYTGKREWAHSRWSTTTSTGVRDLHVSGCR
jgi:hypothetical protein